jgi:glutamine amidotransferase
MTGDVVIVDYGSGNLRSAEKAFQRAVAEAGLALEVVVTDAAERVARAERVVVPGVGAFADCRNGLRAVDGMWQAVEEAAIGRGRPFLGICIGMQLMAEVGLEHGRHAGFGWIAGEVEAIHPADPALKVPHMGWNTLELPAGRPHPLFAGIDNGAYVYFLHSYHFEPDDPAAVLARADYGGPVVAAAGRDNLAGTQFHPEKSQAVGLAVIRNFLEWRP